MTDKKKKEKKTCQYKRHDYKCDRPLFDEKHCVFHSMYIEGKKDTFMEAFWKEYESQKKKKKFNFIGFVFPTGAELQGARLLEAELQGADLRGARLQGTKLFEADLRGADLRWADLQGAKLRGVKLQGTNLWGANLRGADLWKANLQGANLWGADLRGADLWKADLRGADLWKADLRGAYLRYSSLDKAIVGGVKVNRLTKFRGIDVTRAHGSPRFVRFAKDQEFLEELQSTKWGRVIYHIWNVFADCGRSIWRWIAWSLFFAVYFAINFNLIYYVNPLAFHFNSSIEATNFGSFLYYSIVTFTTLGFGDIIPTANYVQRWVMVEVVIGYVMLGGLISIFANKLARRS